MSNDLVRLQIQLALSGEPLSTLSIQLDGQPIPGGGVQLLDSTVDLGTRSQPALYVGRVIALEGSNVRARVTGPRGRADLLAQLQIDASGSRANGTVSSRPADAEP